MEINIAVVDDLEIDCRHIEECIERYFSYRLSVTVRTAQLQQSYDLLQMEKKQYQKTLRYRHRKSVPRNTYP